MKLLFLSLVLLVTSVTGTAFSLVNRCSCSTYSQTFCSAIGYCSWVNGACVDLQCSSVTSDKCTGSQTEYKCGLSTSSNACASKTYSCSDFTTSDECGVNYGFDCIWNASTSKCIDFTCTGMDSANCDFYRCSYINGVCGSPQTVDCSTQTTTSCGTNRPGKGIVCTLNDSNVCISINMLPKNCSDYSDYQVYCNAFCKYESSTKTCRNKLCSDFTSQTECKFIANYYYLTYTPCYWSGSACSEATDANIQTFDVLSCVAYTAYHYTWDLNASKCVQCTTLSDYSYVSTMNEILNGKNSSQNSSQSPVSSSQSHVLIAVILSMLLLD